MSLEPIDGTGSKYIGPRWKPRIDSRDPIDLELFKAVEGDLLWIRVEHTPSGYPYTVETTGHYWVQGSVTVLEGVHFLGKGTVVRGRTGSKLTVYFAVEQLLCVA